MADFIRMELELTGVGHRDRQVFGGGVGGSGDREAGLGKERGG